MLLDILKSMMLKGARTSASNKAVVGAGMMATGLPQRAMQVIAKRLYTEVTIPSTNRQYGELCKELEKNSIAALSNAAVMEGSLSTCSYGVSWAKFEDSYVMVKREKHGKDGESIIMTFFGVSKEAALEKVEKFLKRPQMSDVVYTYYPTIDIFKIQGKEFNYIKSDYIRREESVFLDEETLTKINKRIDEFVARKKWYIERGIPYKYALLLHGQPGTGKTTIAKYIAGRLKRRFVVSSPMEMAYHTASFSRCVVLMEDIDTDASTRSRSLGGGATYSRGPEGDYMQGSLGDLLNAIDGVNCAEDCIIIGTTNHVDKIDPALLRKGRFDDVIEIKPLETREIVRMVKFFFDDQTLTGFLPVYRPTVGANVQDIIMNTYAEGAEATIKALNLACAPDAPPLPEPKPKKRAAKPKSPKKKKKTLELKGLFDSNNVLLNVDVANLGKGQMFNGDGGWKVVEIGK